MQVTKVKGTVVSSYKTDSLTGLWMPKLLSQYEVAGDIVDAGLEE